MIYFLSMKIYFSMKKEKILKVIFIIFVLILLIKSFYQSNILISIIEVSFDKTKYISKISILKSFDWIKKKKKFNKDKTQ